MNEDGKAAVVQFVMDKFQEPIVMLKEFPAYEDTNLLVQSTKCSSNSNSEPTKFVLKIKIISYNNETMMECLTRRIHVVKYLKSKNFVCSDFILGIDGNYIQIFPENSPFDKRSALLYTFVEGRDLEYTGYVNHSIVISELGSFLAYFHNSLKDMPCKNDLVPDSVDPWHLQNYRLLLEDYLDVVEDTSRTELVSTTMRYVVDSLSSSEHLMTKDILHGDFHGLNIIVNESYNPLDRSQYSPCFGRPNPPNDHSNQHSGRQTCVSLNYTSNNSCLTQETSSFKLLISLAEKVRNTDWEIQTSFCKELLDVYGIIDFEAMSYSYTVLEVGRLIADIMVVYLVQCKSDTINVESLHHCKDAIETISHSKPVDATSTESISNCKSNATNRKPISSCESDITKREFISDCKSDRESSSHCEADATNTPSIPHYKPDAATSSKFAPPILNGDRMIHQDINVQTDLSESSKDHLLKIGGYVLAGYMLVKGLSIADMECLYPSVLVSLCQYYILGTKAALDPTLCQEYVGYCSSESIALVEFLQHIDHGKVIHTWVISAEEMFHKCNQINVIKS